MASDFETVLTEKDPDKGCVIDELASGFSVSAPVEYNPSFLSTLPVKVASS